MRNLLDLTFLFLFLFNVPSSFIIDSVITGVFLFFLANM